MDLQEKESERYIIIEYKSVRRKIDNICDNFIVSRVGVEKTWGDAECRRLRSCRI